MNAILTDLATGETRRIRMSEARRLVETYKTERCEAGGCWLINACGDRVMFLNVR